MNCFLFKSNVIRNQLVNNIINSTLKRHAHSSSTLTRHAHSDSTHGRSRISLDYGKWDPVIGLEIHAQISSQSKLFSGGSTSYKTRTNGGVSFFDAALPGSLPVVNRVCVEAGILTALSLNCRINSPTSFDRKHYFYPDIPSGFQMTQDREPVGIDGYLDFCVYNKHLHNCAYRKRSRVRQIQLEQDSGKTLTHNSTTTCLIDLNRAGIGLLELVFQPDLSNGEEAICLVRDLILILKSINTCTCRMEEGTLRVDANVSIRPLPDSRITSPVTQRSGSSQELRVEGSSQELRVEGSSQELRVEELSVEEQVVPPLGVRTEVKNLNSLKSISRAINYEIRRQIELLESGGEVINETRMFDAAKDVTVVMRDKEVDNDYRFMPEPNLPPLWFIDSGSNDTNPNNRNPNNGNPNDRNPNDSGSNDGESDGSGIGLIDIDEFRRKLKPSPDEKRKELMSKYGIDLTTAFRLVPNEEYRSMFERLMEERRDREIVNQEERRDSVIVNQEERRDRDIVNQEERRDSVIVNLLFDAVEPILEERKETLSESRLTLNVIGDIVDMIQSKTISIGTGTDLLTMASDGLAFSGKDSESGLKSSESTNRDPKNELTRLVKENEWYLIHDPQEIRSWCECVIEEKPKRARDYSKKGKKFALNVLMLVLKKKTFNRINDKDAKDMFGQLLNPPQVKEEEDEES